MVTFHAYCNSISQKIQMFRQRTSRSLSRHCRQDPEFGTVDLSFASFSLYLDEVTGKTKVLCSKDEPNYCPTLATIRNIKTMPLWGEGVEGNVRWTCIASRLSDVGRGGTPKLLTSFGVADDGSLKNCMLLIFCVLSLKMFGQ